MPVLVSAALALSVVVVLSPLGPPRSTAQQLDEPSPQLRDAAAELRRIVPDGARFATRRDLVEITSADPIEPDRVGEVQPAFWLAYASGRNSLNGFGIESSSTPGPNVEVDGFALGNAPDAEADFFSSLGVTHLVTMTDELAAQPASSDRFELLWRKRPIAIFAVHPRPGQPDPASQIATVAPATARLRRADPERLRIDVDATRATRADIAAAWSPKWHGGIDGRAVQLDRTSAGLITVRLPAGSSTLELTYGPDAWDRVGVVVSALTLLVLVALGLVWWRRRRQELRASTR